MWVYEDIPFNVVIAGQLISMVSDKDYSSDIGTIMRNTGNPEYVRAMVASIVKDQDRSRYIL